MSVPPDVREILQDDVTEQGMRQWFAPREALYRIDHMAVLVEAERLVERLQRGQGGA